MQNFEKTATEALWEAGQPGWLAYFHVWSSFSESTQTFKGYIYICINASMECVVCSSQLNITFCFMFEQVNCNCQLLKSIWTAWPNCNINLYWCHMKEWHIIISYEDSVVNNIYHVSLKQRDPRLATHILSC